MELNNHIDYGKEALLKTEEMLADIKNLYSQLSKLKGTVGKKWNLPLGCIFACLGYCQSSSALKLDGSVLSSTDYPAFYNYVLANKDSLSTCTSEEFEAEAGASGYCEKFVIDETLMTVRIPLASGLATMKGNFSPLYIVVKCDEN